MPDRNFISTDNFVVVVVCHRVDPFSQEGRERQRQRQRQRESERLRERGRV